MNTTIPFNKAPRIGLEDEYILDALNSQKLAGDGPYSRRCQAWFESKIGCPRALLTPSCTHALEMAAILVDISPGDEIILPSYTFVSTANAFVLRGAICVFVDIRMDTLNIDERLIEAAITPRTKAIVPVHYAGVGCEMDVIMDIAQRYGLWVIEDAAQGMDATWRGRPLGTIGHLGAYSFHETKNFTAGGEGGLLLVNEKKLIERAEIIREKGTNRSHFFRGMVDKYTWVDIGSSFLLSDLQAAYLWGQLAHVDKITENRMATWEFYFNEIKRLNINMEITSPVIPLHCRHNAHMFPVRCQNLGRRTELIEHFKADRIQAAFHYVPLHSAPAGKTFGRFHGEDRHTTSLSESLVRLPVWYGISQGDCEYIVSSLHRFCSSKVER